MFVAYVGDSILGNGVNLGAGTKLDGKTARAGDRVAVFDERDGRNWVEAVLIVAAHYRIGVSAELILHEPAKAGRAPYRGTSWPLGIMAGAQLTWVRLSLFPIGGTTDLRSSEARWNFPS